MGEVVVLFPRIAAGLPPEAAAGSQRGTSQCHLSPPGVRAQCSACREAISVNSSHLAEVQSHKVTALRPRTDHLQITPWPLRPTLQAILRFVQVLWPKQPPRAACRRGTGGQVCLPHTVMFTIGVLHRFILMCSVATSSVDYTNLFSLVLRHVPPLQM